MLYAGGKATVAGLHSLFSSAAPKYFSGAETRMLKNISARDQTSIAGTNAGWCLPEKGGAVINSRRFTEHALERMAPNTPQVMAQLEARALERARAAGLHPQTRAFSDWMMMHGPNPRGIPPSVIEAEIANPGTTGVRVILNQSGDVVTVIPGR